MARVLSRKKLDCQCAIPSLAETRDNGLSLSFVSRVFMRWFPVSFLADGICSA